MLISPERLGEFRPLYVGDKGNIWASKGYDLYFSENGGNSFTKLASYLPPLTDYLSAKFRLTTRLLRSGFHNLIPFSDGTVLVVVRGQMLKLIDGNVFRSTFNFNRGSRPLNICQGPEERIVWGEYFDNPNREEVHVFSSEDKGENWEAIYTFPKDSIRHVHGVFYDHYRNGYWLLTGDDEKECRICFSTDFKSVEIVISGAQNCRAVSIIPFPDGIVVPMDSPFEKNFIQWLDTNNRRLTKLCPLPNSAFFTSKAAGVHVISTAVEKSAVNADRHSYLVCSNDGQDWKEFYRQEKDGWCMKYFQYGVFNLPQGDGGGDYLYAEGQALKFDDGVLLRWPVSEVMKILH